MNNKDLITQYVNTGIGIPRYQYDKLSNNNKTSYLKKIEISIKYDVDNIKYYYAELPEDVQMAAVKQDVLAIWRIDNPSPAVQLAAVNKTAFAIRLIKNPSEAVQLAAVEQNGNAIRLIKNPSEAVQLAAVEQNGDAIRLIKNPSPEVQMAAVKENANAIRRIKNPTPEAIALDRKLYGS